jgi:hypothetical protein
MKSGSMSKGEFTQKRPLGFGWIFAGQVGQVKIIEN